MKVKFVIGYVGVFYYVGRIVYLNLGCCVFFVKIFFLYVVYLYMLNICFVNKL